MYCHCHLLYYPSVYCHCHLLSFHQCIVTAISYLIHPCIVTVTSYSIHQCIVTAISYLIHQCIVIATSNRYNFYPCIVTANSNLYLLSMLSSSFHSSISHCHEHIFSVGPVGLASTVRNCSMFILFSTYWVCSLSLNSYHLPYQLANLFIKCIFHWVVIA